MIFLRITVLAAVLQTVCPLEFPFIHKYYVDGRAEVAYIRNKTGLSADNSKPALFYIIVPADEVNTDKGFDKLSTYIDPCGNETELSEIKRAIHQDHCDLKRLKPPLSNLCNEEPEVKKESSAEKKFAIIWTSVSSEDKHICRHYCQGKNGTSVSYIKSLQCQQETIPKNGCEFPECWEAQGNFSFQHIRRDNDLHQFSAQAMYTNQSGGKQSSSLFTPFIQQSYHTCSVKLRYNLEGSDVALKVQLLSLDNNLTTLYVIKNLPEFRIKRDFAIGQIINPAKLVMTCIGTGAFSCTVYKAEFSDCDDFVHEVPCSQLLNPFQCLSSHHTTCHTDVQCNGRDDCLDGRDEQACPAEVVQGRVCLFTDDTFCDYWGVAGTINETSKFVMVKKDENGTALPERFRYLLKETEKIEKTEDSYLILMSPKENFGRFYTPSQSQPMHLMSPMFPPTIADNSTNGGLAHCTVRLTVCRTFLTLLVNVSVPGLAPEPILISESIDDRNVCLWEEIVVRLKRQPLPFRLVLAPDGKEVRDPRAALAIKHISLNPACFHNGSTTASYLFKNLTSCNVTGASPPTDSQCNLYSQQKEDNPAILTQNGTQQWTAPETNRLHICGAAGGHHSGDDIQDQVKGSCIYLRVWAQLGETFTVLIGQRGEYSNGGGGGGGATFIIYGGTILAVVPGGGGNYVTGSFFVAHKSKPGASVDTNKTKISVSTTTADPNIGLLTNTISNSTDEPVKPRNNETGLLPPGLEDFYLPSYCMDGLMFLRKGGFGGGGAYCGAGGGGGAGYTGGAPGFKTSGSRGQQYVNGTIGYGQIGNISYWKAGLNIGDGFIEIYVCNHTCPAPTRCDFDIKNDNVFICTCPNGRIFYGDLEKDCADQTSISHKILIVFVIILFFIVVLIVAGAIWWHWNLGGTEMKRKIRRRFNEIPNGRKFSSVKFSTIEQRMTVRPIEEVIQLLQDDPRKLKKIPADGLLEYMRLIPHYCIQMGEPIGAGHFGAVYKGETMTENGRTEIACKYVECGDNNNDGVSVKRQVIMEGLLMSCASLLSKTTIQALGMAVHDKSFILVMEYMNGGDLAKYLKNNCRPRFIEGFSYENPEQLLLGDMIQFMLDICSGCDALETLKCVHRDLAARNCLLKINPDSSKTVKIGDFGLAKEAESSEYEAGQKRSALPVKWLPLEAIEESNYSAKTDVWSFGVVCWEILTRGKPPYGQRTSSEVANLVKLGKRLKLPDETPKELRELIFRCWYANPEMRPNFRNIGTELKAIFENSRSLSIPLCIDSIEHQLATPDYQLFEEDWCFQLSIGTPSTIATELTTPKSPMDLAFVLDRKIEYEPLLTPRSPDTASLNSSWFNKSRCPEPLRSTASASSNVEEIEMRYISLKTSKPDKKSPIQKDMTHLFPQASPASTEEFRKLVNETYMVPDSKKKKLTPVMTAQPKTPQSLNLPPVSTVAVERPTTLNSQERFYPMKIGAVHKKIINESYEIAENKKRTPATPTPVTPLDAPTSVERPNSLSKQVKFAPIGYGQHINKALDDFDVDFAEVLEQFQKETSQKILI